MLSRGWIEVDLGALVRNAQALQERAGVPLIPMIKAGAYGLGAEQAAFALESLPPMAYGIATVGEGVELRNAGITRPILIFTPLLESDMELAHDARLTPTLGSAAEIEAWERYGGAYHLSIDTGMSRAGLPWREMKQVIPVVKRHPPEGAFTHFHSAASVESMKVQEERFREALSLLPERPRVLHADSSAAIARHNGSEWDAVRPGIFLYGVGSGEGAGIEPECVVHMRAPIVETRWVEAGDTVSYDATWTAPSRRLIATIPLGYADGYPRNASNRGVGVVRQQIVPITGRVTMDMMMFDVTDTGAEIGDIITIIGNGAETNAPISVAAVAEFAGMSPYELLTDMRGRLRHLYRG